MKKIVSGISLTFLSVVLFGIVFIKSSNYYIKLAQWNTPPGKFVTSIIETGGYLPFVTSICLFVCGIILLLWGTFEK